MSDKTNGSASASTSAVATNDGKLVQLPDMVVAATRIHNFVEKFRKEFEDHLEGRPCPFEKAGKPEMALA